MKRQRRHACSLTCILASTLAACGGGGGGDAGSAAAPEPPTASPQELHGIAASGQAMAGATVIARCADGSTVSGSTDSDGRFALTLGAASAAILPCMLKATSSAPAREYYSYAQVEGNVNVNPLTDLTLTKALRAPASDVFANFGSTVKSVGASELGDAAQFAESGIELTSGRAVTVYSDYRTPDPFTYPFSLGNDRDKAFDALAASLAVAGLSFADYRQLVADNATLRESFGATIVGKAITDRVKPVVDSVECVAPTLNGVGVVECTVRGRNLTRPGAFLPGNVDSDIGIVVSRSSLHQPKTDPTRPWKPALCSASAATLGAIHRSTDSEDPQGPDPAGVFAESIEMPCGATIDFVDDLVVEVVQYQPGEGADVASWPLVQPGVSATLTVKAPAGVASVDAISCDSVVVPGLEFVHATWPDLKFQGRANVPSPSQDLQVFLSNSALSDAELQALMSSYDFVGSHAHQLVLVDCDGAYCNGIGPLTNVTFAPSATLSDGGPLSIYYLFPNLYASQTLWVYAVVIDLANAAHVVSSNSKSVVCPSFGRPS